MRQEGVNVGHQGAQIESALSRWNGSDSSLKALRFASTLFLVLSLVLILVLRDFAKSLLIARREMFLFYSSLASLSFLLASLLSTIGVFLGSGAMKTREELLERGFLGDEKFEKDDLRWLLETGRRKRGLFWISFFLMALALALFVFALIGATISLQ